MVTGKLARFIIETQEIPEAVLRETKVALADTLGVGLAGTLEPVAEIALRCSIDAGGNPLDLQIRYLAVYGNRDGIWQLRSWQSLKTP